MHPFTFGTEFVDMSDTHSIFQHNCFIYPPPIGVRKSRDSPISFTDLMTSGHLSTFTSLLQELKSDSGKRTRDSHGHPECSSVAQKDHYVPQDNEGASGAHQNNTVNFVGLNS